MQKWLLIFVSLTFITPSFANEDNNPGVDAMQEYFEFAEYRGGTIFADHLKKLDPKSILFIDTRNATQYETDHITGAINIEWRQILNHKNEIPKDRTVVLYCDTGLLSSKAHFALSIAGFENTRVLYGGYLQWEK